LSVGERDFAAQEDLRGGAADENGEIAGVGAPFLGVHVVIIERARIENDADMLRFAGLEIDAGKSLELLWRTRDFCVGFADVNLGDIGAFARAGVFHVEGNLEARAGIGAGGQLHGDGTDLQLAVVEVRVGQAEAEGKERLDPIVFVAAIANENSFLVDHAVRAGRRIVAVVHWIIGPFAFEGDGETAGEIGIADEKLGERAAALLTGIPGFDQSGNAGEPGGHICIAAGRENGNRIFVGGSHGLDERVLSRWKSKGSVGAFTFGFRIVADCDDHGVGLGCESFGIRQDDRCGIDDAQAQMAADPARLAVMLKDDFVRLRIERESDAADDCESVIPVVENGFPIDGKTVIAAVFTR